ncbi:probable E3 ubiquitin-protein ligase bre1 [Stegastes partitus]|uniref:Probable E3 ubiquitin-protein ligase bre1 n=1 Tax=Stegastes partitus TaxID=144197 RepID=A0A9Y4N9A9_9TELE|nr:PREDICTED: probable E3 ubiquitin-protein ligase bre1 [Stegastes partitus]
MRKDEVDPGWDIKVGLWTAGVDGWYGGQCSGVTEWQGRYQSIQENLGLAQELTHEELEEERRQLDQKQAQERERQARSRAEQIQKDRIQQQQREAEQRQKEEQQRQNQVETSKKVTGINAAASVQKANVSLTNIYNYLIFVISFHHFSVSGVFSFDFLVSTTLPISLSRCCHGDESKTTTKQRID